MSEAYTIDLRRRVVEAHERGDGSYRALAERFSIGEATAKRWVWQFRRDGTLTPRKKGGGNRSDISVAVLERIVGELGDGNADEITAAYNRGRRGKARRHVSSIKRALNRAGYVIKKNGSGRQSSSGPTWSKSAKLSGG